MAAGLLAISAAGLNAQRLQYRVLAEGQAVDGRLWLYAGGWGWLERVELGRIEGGTLDATVTPETFPEQWRFAANNGYLVALETDGGRWYRSEMRVSPHEPPEAVIARSALLESLPSFVAELGSVETLGGEARTLVLPEQKERRITLLHEDGSPLAGETIGVDLFVWRQNHCGAAQGLGFTTGAVLGERTTDARGSFSVPDSGTTLLLRRRYYPVVDSGSGAVLRQHRDTVEIEPGDDVTIRSMWDAPRSEGAVSVRLLSLNGEPVPGWYVVFDMNFNTCGPPTYFQGPSDAQGWIRFQTSAGLPASLTRAMTVHGADVPGGDIWDRPRIHDLTREELLRFARDGTITLRLEKP